MMFWLQRSFSSMVGLRDWQHGPMRQAEVTPVQLQASKAASAKAKLGSTAGDKSGKSPAVSRDQVLRRWTSIDIVRTASLPSSVTLKSWLRGIYILCRRVRRAWQSCKMVSASLISARLRMAPAQTLHMVGQSQVRRHSHVDELQPYTLGCLSQCREMIADLDSIVRFCLITAHRRAVIAANIAGHQD
jgi:hypothetical protein